MKYLDLWKLKWESSQKGRETLNYIKEVNEGNIYSDFYINQVITGQGVFPRHQADRFNKNEMCIYVTAIDTIEHVIRDCVLIDDVRTKHFSC